MKVIDYISTGYKNSITRKKLCSLTGLSDRDMRHQIEKLKVDYPICNYQDGKGYFIAETPEEAERMLKQEGARIKAISNSCRGLRKYYNSCEVI